MASPLATPHPIPGPKALWNALRELSGLPGAGPADMGASAFFYPVIGAALGGSLYLFDRATSSLLDVSLRSACVVLLGAVFTGGRAHADLSRLVAALGFRERGRFLLRSAGPPNWPLVVASLFLEVWLVAHLGKLRPVGLLFAPLLGVWSTIVLGFGSRAARADGRRVKFAEEVTFTEFAISSVATFAFVFWLTQFLGILLVCIAATLIVGIRLTFHAYLDGIPETALGATWQVVALVTLAVLAAF
jgi:cobalamin synthase